MISKYHNYISVTISIKSLQPLLSQKILIIKNLPSSSRWKKTKGNRIKDLQPRNWTNVPLNEMYDFPVTISSWKNDNFTCVKNV